jgi:uncharacterized protein (TIGR02271 family)
MTQLTSTDVQSAIDQDLYDSNDAKVGTITDVYLDNDTREPEWALVRTGMFGTKESFVPLAGASTMGDGVRVGFSKEQIKDAPRAEADGELSEAEEAELYRHYGLQYSEAPSDSGLPTGAPDVDTNVDTAGARDTSGPNTDSAVTRSEERLNLSTVRRPSQLVRLRKTIETENVSTTVPVEHEVVRIEREPITDANVGQAMSGADLSTEEVELTLTEEQVVVDKDVVPVERIRLDKDVVTEQQAVTESVRKERFDVEGAVDSVAETARR